MNKAILIGNLTRDPEVRTTPSGVNSCTFSLAVNRRYVNKQTGQREADFINIVVWRELADLCARYLAKGRKVAVVGSISTRSYDAQDGTKRYVTEVVADEVEFLSAPQGSGAGRYDDAPPPPESSAPSPYSGGSAKGFTRADDDDELPF